MVLLTMSEGHHLDGSGSGGREAERESVCVCCGLACELNTSRYLLESERKKKIIVETMT